MKKQLKVREVSHIWYEDKEGRVEIKDRADGIEKGVNKFLTGEINEFTIKEETKFTKTE